MTNQEILNLADDLVSERFNNPKKDRLLVGYWKSGFLDGYRSAIGLPIEESKKSVRKAMKEQFVGKGEGGYRKPDKTKFNSGICLDSNGVKHTVIFDTRVEDFIVWVDNDNYLMWYVSSPQSLLNNLAESDLDENLILDIVALWEKLPKKRIKK